MAGKLRIPNLSVIIIVAAVFSVVFAGGHFSSMNRDWYEALNKPAWQPPNWVFPVVWTILFALMAISAILVWNARPRRPLAYLTILAFLVNGFLNIGWSYFFFANKLIFPAAYEAMLLFLSVVLIMILAWPISRLASLLLIPYALWTAFATYLTLTIYRLNP